MEFLENFRTNLGVGIRRALPVSTRRAYAPVLSPNQIFSSAKPPVTPLGASLGIAGKLWSPLMMGIGTINQAQKVFNPEENIVTELVNLGSGLSNLVQGKPYLEGRTSGFGSRPVTATLPQRLIANLPADYKQTELAAGAAAEAFRPGAGFPGQQFSVPVVPQLSPEERAYNQERSRIAQLTAATPEERSKLRDEGMRIWAAKYGDLAKKVKPGQSGYEVIQQVLNK
jgi:hypothetical protein